MDEKIIDWGVGYLKRRFPIVQLDGEETIRNVVSDLMFIGMHGQYRERAFSRATVGPGERTAAVTEAE